MIKKEEAVAAELATVAESVLTRFQLIRMVADLEGQVEKMKNGLVPTDEVDRLRAEKDQAYLERNYLVALLARIYPSGTRPTEIEGWNPEWNGCVYIDLPKGKQISYHYHESHAHLFASLPRYKGVWDGHDKEAVHQRLIETSENPRRLDTDWLLRYVMDRLEHLPKPQVTADTLRSVNTVGEAVTLVNGYESGARLDECRSFELAILRKSVADSRHCDPSEV